MSVVVLLISVSNFESNMGRKFRPKHRYLSSFANGVTGIFYIEECLPWILSIVSLGSMYGADLEYYEKIWRGNHSDGCFLKRKS